MLKLWIIAALFSNLISGCTSLSGGAVLGSLFTDTDNIQVFLEGPPESEYEKICEIDMTLPAFSGNSVQRKDFSKDLKVQAAKCKANAVYIESFKQIQNRVEIRGWAINLLVKEVVMNTLEKKQEFIAAVIGRKYKKISALLKDMPSSSEKRSTMDNLLLQEGLSIAASEGSRCHQKIVSLLNVSYEVTVSKSKLFKDEFFFCGKVSLDSFDIFNDANKNEILDRAFRQLILVHKNYRSNKDKAKMKYLMRFFKHSSAYIAERCGQDSSSRDQAVCMRKTRFIYAGKSLKGSSNVQKDQALIELSNMMNN